MTSSSIPRWPLLRVMASNAFLLSVGYLALGVVAEVVRRAHPSERLRHLSWAFDALPSQALAFCKLLPLLRESYYAGQLSEREVRAVYGLTSIGVIFLLAAVVGMSMYGVRRVWELARRRR